MCIEEGSLEKNGSREEGVAGVKGAGESGGGRKRGAKNEASEV